MIEKKKRVLVLTSTNLACNPRCLKEVRLLTKMGHAVTLVAFHLHNWTEDKERQLREELKDVEFHYLEAGRHPLIPWLKASLLERAARLLLPVAGSNIFLAALSMDKRSWMLLQWVKKNKGNYQGVIAHNPPAFYAAAWLGRKASVPYAIDIEDYHPGEGKSAVKRRCSTLLMRGLLKPAAYVSFASPLIKEYSGRLADAAPAKWTVINNSFPRTDFLLPEAAGEKLQIVWFSQFVDYGRGLEKILPVLDEFRGQIQLTLIGSARAGFVAAEVAGREYVRCIGAMAEKELHEALRNYDLGLALEDGTADLNRDLCLTNKIWSYLLAGLYILASDTSAQRRFMDEHPGHGACVPLTADRLRPLLAKLAGDKSTIRADAPLRFAQASTVAWESESAKLTTLWNLILQ
jgi:glycosyltransferase involved in cell wall biosynthesis